MSIIILDWYENQRQSFFYLGSYKNFIWATKTKEVGQAASFEIQVFVTKQIIDVYQLKYI